MSRAPSLIDLSHCVVMWARPDVTGHDGLVRIMKGTITVLTLQKPVLCCMNLSLGALYLGTKDLHNSAVVPSRTDMHSLAGIPSTGGTALHPTGVFAAACRTPHSSLLRRGNSATMMIQASPTSMVRVFSEGSFLQDDVCTTGPCDGLTCCMCSPHSCNDLLRDSVHHSCSGRHSSSRQLEPCR